MNDEKSVIDRQTTADLNTLNSLLRDSSFAVKIAQYEEAKYKVGRNTALKSTDVEDSSIEKTLKEQKIAINLAGFYATECGIGALSKITGQKPLTILKKIVERDLDSSQILLLNRFANATWKASQPFRDLRRIQNSNFIVATFLSPEEIKKDYDQILAASTLLLNKLKTFPTEAPAKEQFKAIEKLMKNTAFALEMAAHMEAAYYQGQNQPVPAFITVNDETTTMVKRTSEDKLSANLGGFYALICGLEYLSFTQSQPSSKVLRDILENRLEDNDKDLLQRFANATWKAGQPFLGMNRITLQTFQPFDLLPKEERQKDWQRIITAAEFVHAEMSKASSF